MVGESFHQRGCRGEDDDHIRLGAIAKLSRLFVSRDKGSALVSRLVIHRLHKMNLRNLWIKNFKLGHHWDNLVVEFPVEVFV